MKRRGLGYQVSVCVMILLVAATHGMLAADDRIDLIRQCWEKRRSLSENLYMKLSSVRVEPPPSREITDADRAAGRTGPRPHHLKTEMWFSDDKIAISIERNKKEVPWLSSKDLYVHTDQGSQYLFAHTEGQVFDSNSTGGVSRKQRVGHYGLYQVFFPPVLAFRPAGSGPLSFSLSEATISAETKRVGDVECLAIVTDQDGQYLQTKEVWVDPKRDFLPIRILTQLNQKPNNQFDMTYITHPTVGHQLVSWKFTSVGSNGELSVSEDVIVDVFDAVTPIPDSQFRIDFPIGATITVDGLSERVKVGPNGEIPGFTNRGVGSGTSVLVIAGVVTVIVLCAAWIARRQLTLR